MLQVNDMSRRFCTPRKTHLRRRTTNSYFLTKSSTPYKNVPVKHYSLSLSGIDTGSSSSVGENRKRQQISEKRKKTTSKKKRVVAPLPDTESEWETKSEEVVQETNSRRSGSKHPQEEGYDDSPVNYNLFEDLRSPEKVRDAPIAHELLLESPILRSSRRSRFLPVKDRNVVQRKEFQLVVADLQLSKTQDVSSEESDDDALKFDREKATKTYLPASQKREENLIRGPWKLIPRVREDPTEMSGSFLQFVDKFLNEMSYYLESPSTRLPVKVAYPARGVPYVLPRRRTDPVPPGMKRVRRRCDRATRITCSDSERENSSERKDLEGQNERKTDGKARGRIARKRGKKAAALRSAQKRKADVVYDQSDETDIEFQMVGHYKKRIGFREFYRKQNVKSQIRAPSTSSHSDTQ